MGCGAELDQAFQANVAGFHSVLHAGRKHGSPRLGIRQGHPHSHQGAGPVRLEFRFNVTPLLSITMPNRVSTRIQATRAPISASMLPTV